MEVNSIGALKRMAVKPRAWKLIEDAPGLWGVAFHWGASADSPDDWHSLKTARGERRQYKSSDAALADIRSVDSIDDRAKIDVILM